MSIPQIHPAWAKPPARMTDGYSLEMTAKDVPALRAAANRIARETPIAITFLPNETMDARIAAAAEVRALGFEPMPHLSARRIASHEELEAIVAGTVAEAGRQARVPGRRRSAGARRTVRGYDGAAANRLVRTNTASPAVGIAGHPEGHPTMSEAQCWEALEIKRAEITARGMATLIVTQFAFDADPILAWLLALRARGIDAPVRIGVPGPAGIKTLAALRGALRRRRIGKRDGEIRRLDHPAARHRRAGQAGRSLRRAG